ncbi:MAG: AAC(3) family N-acetyltransferase [Rhodobacter sp.]|nr:AAC(3) family N-acetyltransferase [Rhodobacter sp.]
MAFAFHTRSTLLDDLGSLGVRRGDGLFVHASMKAIGYVVGGPRTILEALLEAVGDTGLIGMPGFSTDAYFPSEIDRSDLSPGQIAEIEDAVPGFDVLTSPTSDIGILPETFRTWPGTERSDHPVVSICLNGLQAREFVGEHSLAWATGLQSPLGKLRDRQSMKILLIGVGWDRCTALHTSETLADHRRTKTRRLKVGAVDGTWVESPDVADDVGRLFPTVGDAFEKTGSVSIGSFGEAHSRICDYRQLVDFGSELINEMNKESGDLA